jgi:hypothetical protein
MKGYPKPVRKIAADGTATVYPTIRAAADDNFYDSKTIRRACARGMMLNGCRYEFTEAGR